MTSDAITVQRTIKAAPAQIFALLADAAKHSQFDGSGSVRGTRQDSQPLSLGTTFGMSMHMGIPYSTSNTVVEFEPDRRIAWKTTGLKGLIGGRVWRYELEPTTDGTIVRETWDLSQDKQGFLLKRSKMAGKTKNDMRKTLDRIAQTLEG
ncbi:SRPBCC family protein [Aeromicrobium wangtongii]|uniref:SRPBCC family protein n=1 Tax=Aeromicrobium wangtongii TaxID=2969247 RepID=UPI002016C131|nr:SRPBCC family protein [Aeromicrobium wangtongii]MCL3817457.1 SRPBCC family protein [Aeromicrobium wangtongii]